MKKYSVFHTNPSPVDYRMTSYLHEHIVKKGDTLYKIAQMHNVKLEDLIASNNLTSSTIFPNQIIVIPKSVTNGGVYFEEYVIQDNETMQEIANKTKVSVDLLTKYNDVSKLILQENQVIKIPKKTNRRTYVIQEADTLESILAKTQMSLEELIRANAHKWLISGTPINVK